MKKQHVIFVLKLNSRLKQTSAGKNLIKSIEYLD